MSLPFGFNQYRQPRTGDRPQVRPDAFTGLAPTSDERMLDALRVRPGETDREAWQRLMGIKNGESK